MLAYNGVVDSNSQEIKLTYLTAGAAGMYCGSCMHDNTLVRALREIGFDATLVPTYTPIRTDETSVAVDQVFFGGINVYLQQRIPIFRALPRFMDRFLDRPGIIRRATSRSIDMKPEMLGALALSMLKGNDGNQRKEVRRLTDWLKHTEAPDLLMFSNLLIGGCIPYIKQQLDLPVIVTLQGDDVFLDSLPDLYRSKCIERMRTIADSVDCFITHSQFYRDYMADYLGIAVDKIKVTPLGLDTSEFESITNQKQSGDFHLGYLARIAPEKGLHYLVDALLQITQSNPDIKLKLSIAGWLGDDHNEYAEKQFTKLRESTWQDRFEYLGSVDRHDKLKMLGKIDLMCVPTEFLEPKGIYALEAMAAGVPVLAPDHGAFPELLNDTQGGVLFSACNVDELAKMIEQLVDAPQQLGELGRSGRAAVLERRNAQSMAEETAAIIRKLV